MEKIFQASETLLKLLNWNWLTIRMTTSYTGIQLDLIAKRLAISRAEECFLKLPDFLKDNRIFGALLNRMLVGSKWRSIVLGTFTRLPFRLPNLGYHAVISSLVRLDDTEGADMIYDEWFSVKSFCNSRRGNLLPGYYVIKGFLKIPRLSLII
ncbi:unnamed protein product [Fraxinus pennsylvanica]|uniref:Uncharacterized protein n=1 Tax=Fraxinus pennsylvanica TaxID=56036 RepID=A0AAD2DSF2_9LAMI|nr:unnamed protein product [Fraxinus pennsylvanica]